MPLSNVFQLSTRLGRCGWQRREPHSWIRDGSNVWSLPVLLSRPAQVPAQGKEEAEQADFLASEPLCERFPTTPNAFSVVHCVCVCVCVFSISFILFLLFIFPFFQFVKSNVADLILYSTLLFPRIDFSFSSTSSSEVVIVCIVFCNTVFVVGGWLLSAVCLFVCLLLLALLLLLLLLVLLHNSISFLFCIPHHIH